MASAELIFRWEPYDLMLAETRDVYDNNNNAETMGFLLGNNNIVTKFVPIPKTVKSLSNVHAEIKMADAMPYIYKYKNESECLIAWWHSHPKFYGLDVKPSPRDEINGQIFFKYAAGNILCPEYISNTTTVIVLEQARVKLTSNKAVMESGLNSLDLSLASKSATEAFRVLGDGGNHIGKVELNMRFRLFYAYALRINYKGKMQVDKYSSIVQETDLTKLEDSVSVKLDENVKYKVE